MKNLGPAYQSTMACSKALGMSEADCTDLGLLTKNYQQRLNYIGGLVKAKRMHDASHHTRTLLGSTEAKVTALVRTAKRGPDGAPLSLAKIQSQAAKLCLFEPINEPVVVRPAPKPEGGTRMISIFGWNRQAAQLLCCDVLSLYWRPAPFDYQARGMGGCDGALERLTQLIEEEKYPLVVVVDVKNLFGSANKEKVAAHLPLPKRVTHNVLLVQNGVKVVVKSSLQDELAPHTDGSASTPDEAIRQGLPQGSRASGLIMYQGVLGPLLATLPFSDKLVLYGDDLAVPVKDQAEAQATLKALEATLASSPVGSLHIGRHTIAYIRDGVDFLGQHVVRKPAHWGGHLHIHPSQKSYQRFCARVGRRYHLEGGGKAGLRSTIRYKWFWIRSWRLWKPNWQSKLYMDLYLRETIWPALKSNTDQQPKV